MKNFTVGIHGRRMNWVTCQIKLAAESPRDAANRYCDNNPDYIFVGGTVVVRDHHTDEMFLFPIEAIETKPKVTLG